jgi:hypothetical protein
MKHAVTFTLRQIRGHEPCADGWQKLVKSLGGIEKYGLDTPITVEQIVASNGLDDALWALKTLGHENKGWMRHFAVDCAESVKHLMQDERSLKALEVARRHADGLASDSELAAAWADARAALWDAAWDASWAAAWAAERAASWAAERAARAASAAAGADFGDLLVEYCRTGKRVVTAPTTKVAGFQQLEPAVPDREGKC